MVQLLKVAKTVSGLRQVSTKLPLAEVWHISLSQWHHAMRGPAPCLQLSQLNDIQHVLNKHPDLLEVWRTPHASLLHSLTMMTSHVVWSPFYRSVSQRCFSSSMTDHQSCAPGWQACLDHVQASAQLCLCFTGWSAL